MFKKKMIIVAVVSGLVLLLAAVVLVIVISRHGNPDRGYKMYSMDSVSFEYPSTWRFEPCRDNTPLFALPEKLTGRYKTDHDSLSLVGTTMAQCENGTLSVQSADAKQKEACEEQNKGAKLANGLYIDTPYVFKSTEYVRKVTVSRDACSNAVPLLFTFELTDPDSNVGGEQILKYGGEPRIEKAKLMASSQYREIKRFAESIKLRQ